MSDFNAWYKQGETYTHFCGGMTDDVEAAKVGNIKHPQTKTETSYWFFPATVVDDSVKCVSCRLEAKIADIDPIIIPIPD